MVFRWIVSELSAAGSPVADEPIPIPLVISAHIAIPLKEFTPNGGNENPSRLNRASAISALLHFKRFH